jgi:tripeptidyl-peptidase-1
VTAVGATEFMPDEPEEIAAPFSVGGFSSYFKRPEYQDDAVKKYLESTGNTKSTALNVTNRGGTLFLIAFLARPELC